MKRRTRGKGEGTNEVDAIVGPRLRELRMLAGLSQSDLAATIGLTFQQLQKYERGVNRISASKLYLLARHLNVPVSTFFSDLEGQTSGDLPVEPAGTDADAPVIAPAPEEAPFRSREALVLARHFQRIRNPEAKAALKSFVEVCAGIPPTDDGQRTEPRPMRGPGRPPLSPGERAGRRQRRPRGAIWHPTDINKN